MSEIRESFLKSEFSIIHLYEGALPPIYHGSLCIKRYSNTSTVYSYAGPYNSVSGYYPKLLDLYALSNRFVFIYSILE